MRSPATPALILLFVAVAAACKRDEPRPAPAPTVEEASAPVTATPASASASASASALSADAGADAGIDTSKWETRALDMLGKARFAFDGTIMFPKGTKTRTSGAVTSGGGSAGTFAFLNLPDGIEIVLNERSESNVKDGSFEKKLIAQTTQSTVIVDRSDANGFFFAFEQRDGNVLVQGASWAVSPGLGCATQQPIKRAQIEEVAAVCISLRAKPKK